MDIPPELTALRLKTAGLTVAVIAPWILGGCLPIPKPWRTAALFTSFTASIAAILASKKLILQEAFYLARLEISKDAFATELAFQSAALEQALEAEYFPPEPLNVPAPEMLEPNGSLAVQAAEPAGNVPRTQTEPTGYADPLEPGISQNVRGIIVSLKRQGLTQDQIIFQVWGCRKGGSDRYKAAKAKYDFVVAELE